MCAGKRAGPRLTAARRSLGVGGDFLYVAQRDACVQGGGDERVAKRVRADLFDEPCLAGDAADDPPGGVPVEPLARGGGQDRSFAAFADGQVDRACDARREQDDGFLAVLAGDRQGPVPAFCAQGFDVRAGGLGHPEPVKGEQREQGVLGRRAEPGRHEEAPIPGGKGP